MQVIKCSAFAASSHLLGSLIDRQDTEAQKPHLQQGRQESPQQGKSEPQQAAKEPQHAAERVSRAVCILDGSLQARCKAMLCSKHSMLCCAVLNVLCHVVLNMLYCNDHCCAAMDFAMLQCHMLCCASICNIIKVCYKAS